MMGGVLKRILIWRIRHVEHQHLVLFLSVIIGILAGLATFVIKTSAHKIQGLVALLEGAFHYLHFVFPLIGLLLTVTVIKYLIRRPVDHGIPATLQAISKRNSELESHNMFSSIVTSAITVGFGGSVGLEGPTVATGSAYGSNIGKLFHLDYKTKTLLVGCAAAGALSAIFKAPIAAIVFAIEVIMLDLTTASLIPLLLASVSAFITSWLLLGEGVLLPFPFNDPFQPENVPYYILLGAVTGLGSLYFSKLFFGVERLFEKIGPLYLKALIGGSLLGILFLVFPDLYGEGYELINSLIQGQYSQELSIKESLLPLQPTLGWAIGFVFAMVLFKVIATSVTFGSGGIGGIFAPTLFSGSSLGFAFAKSLDYFGLVQLPVSSFTLVGMAGMMAGVLHAPLTAIFLIAEITGGYQLFVPLMITAAISYLTVRAFLEHSVYTQQLADKGELITHHKDRTVLYLMDLKKEVENDFEKVRQEDTLGDLTNAIARSKRDLFPVVNEKDELLGVVFLHQIRNLIFDRDRYDELTVSDLMTTPPAFIQEDEDMNQVMEKFESTGAWNLPVVDGNKYVGFVSKSKIFSAYRHLLVKFSEE
ncbi:MAG: chloride channel protein [Flavobacteriales bacterium]